VFLSLIARFSTREADRYVHDWLYGDAAWLAVDRTAIHLQKRPDDMIDAVLADYEGAEPDSIRPDPFALMRKRKTNYPPLILDPEDWGLSSDDANRLESTRLAEERTNPELSMRRAVRVLWKAPAGAEENLAYVLFETPPSLAIPKIRNFLKLASAPSARLLLRTVEVGCMFLSVRQIFAERDKDQEEWVRLLCETILHAADEGVREDALGVLRRFDGGLGVPRIAVRHFLEGLESDDANVQMRAIWPLVYADGAEDFVPRLRRVVAESELLSMQLQALHVLLYRDGRNWVRNITAFLTRCQIQDLASFIEQQVDSLAHVGDDAINGHERIIATLVGGYNFASKLIEPEGAARTVQEWCLRGLGEFRSPIIAEFLARVFNDQNQSGSVRADALMWFFDMADDWKAKTTVLSASLEDSTAAVRE
jgi:hypothetical protein